jgi:2-keto-4-pentenoate hydratase/2-oxohepta-3-ene-1,7-dioic acid hydratase in catechol pathway
MKLVSFTNNGRQGFGAVVGDDDKIVDLGQRMAGVAGVRALLEQSRLDEARALSVAENADLALADVRLERPVGYPEKIFCIGVNYMNRNAEYADNSDAPKYPSVFVRMPDTLVGHGQPIVRPPESVQLDYEGEIAIVIGREGRRIPESEAESYIAGITCMNEGSVRDWLRHGKFNVTQGKNFVGSGGLGPWLVTRDEIESFDDLTVSTHVNSEQRQHDTTANLAFPFRHLVSYLSTFALLKPGDVIATGTPIGAGARFDPPRWLVPGDRVDVTVSGVGTLTNEVIDEPTR